MAKRAFKPEFINRVDELLVFRKLNRDDLKKIVRLELNKLIKRMAAQGRTFTCSDAAVDLLTEKGYQPEFGARPIRRAVERWIEDPLSELILSGKLKKNIFADTENGEIIFKSKGR